MQKNRFRNKTQPNKKTGNQRSIFISSYLNSQKLSITGHGGFSPLSILIKNSTSWSCLCLAGNLVALPLWPHINLICLQQTWDKFCSGVILHARQLCLCQIPPYCKLGESRTKVRAKVARDNSQPSTGQTETLWGSGKPCTATFPGSGKQNKHSPNAVEQTWAR